MRILSIVVFLQFLLASQSVLAYDHERDFDGTDQNTWPVIAIIIDDIGNQARDGARAVLLPGPVAYAVLPHTPHAQDLARRAHATGKEVMLHLPLEATEHNKFLGKGAINLDDSYSVFLQTLQTNLDAVPFVTGINNHMGSLLTRHPGHMRWLMQAIKDNGNLFFVDSRTTRQSVALSIAKDYAVPSVKRDIFLDSDQNVEAIDLQFSRLKQRARNKGYAVAIGHPFPETLDLLEKELPQLAGLGYRLVSVKDMIAFQQHMQAGTKTLSQIHIQGTQAGFEEVSTSW